MKKNHTLSISFSLLLVATFFFSHSLFLPIQDHVFELESLDTSVCVCVCLNVCMWLHILKQNNTHTSRMVVCVCACQMDNLAYYLVRLFKDRENLKIF